MKLRSIIPIVAAAIMAISTAVIGAGTATAATPSGLCLWVPNLDVTYCAQTDTSPVSMCRAGGLVHCVIAPGVNEWLYNGLNHTGPIPQPSGQAVTGSIQQLPLDN